MGLDFAGVCSSEAEKLMPHQHNVYVYTVSLFTQGRGEGRRVEPERRLEEQQFTKLGENTNTTDCISSL
jgi:hypothetical protein